MPSPIPALGAPVEIIAMATERAVNFKPRAMQRRPIGAHDVLIEIRFCGICHTDVHVAKDDFNSFMPRNDVLVPGHEVAGVVTAIGVRVSRVKVGDRVGVGCLVGSCGECGGCRDEGAGQPACPQQTMAYASKDLTKAGIAATYPKGGFTIGGYSNVTVVHEKFVVLIPRSYPLEFAGPVMCAGVTVYNPLMHFGASKGTRVGIVGPGGLGIMAIKIAKALGCFVTAITTQANKIEFLTKECGADFVIVSSSAAEMAAARRSRSIDLIIDCATGPNRDVLMYESLLSRGGHIILCGISNTMMASNILSNISSPQARLRVSMIGGIRQTQEVIDLCDKYKIFPATKIIAVEEINKAFELLDNNAAGGVRFVVDLSTITTLEETTERCYGVPPPKLSRGGEFIDWAKVIGNLTFLLTRFYWCEPESNIPAIANVAGVALLAGAGALAYKRFMRRS